MTDFPSAAALGQDVPGRDELFPIREVARLTGINPVTLRAWERRYGLIQPVRTESGHRLYSWRDVETVRAAQAWVRRGVPVSRVGELLAREAESVREAAGGGEWLPWQAQVRSAMEGFDEAGLERLYGQAFALWPAAQVFEDILMPVWQAASRRLDGFGRTSEWLFLDAFLRARVLQRLQFGRPATAERVLLAALPGACHELELLVAGLALGGEHLAVSVVPLGTPFEELGLVCERAAPRALVLLAEAAPAAEQLRQVQRLGLGLDCPLALLGELTEAVRGALEGSPLACLGRPGPLAQRRLQQFLAGGLDT